MFSYVNMCNCILNFWHLILYFPLHIHMEKLSLKITYYFITHIATEYEQHLEHLEQYQNNPGENPHIKGMDNLSVCM